MLERASGVMPVIVQQSDVENIRVRVQAPRTIRTSAQWFVSCVSGRLTCGSKAADGAALPIWLEGLDGQPSLLALGVAQAGTFSIEHIPQGRNRILTLAPFVDGHAIPGIHGNLGRLNPSSEELTLTYGISLGEGGQVLLNVDTPVNLSATSLRTAMSGSVRGIVENIPEKSGIPAVVLVPSADYTYGVLVTPQPDGSFVANGLASGSYYAAAFPSLDLAGLRDPEFVRRVISLDRKISVELGSTTELKLPVSAWPD